MIRCELIGGAIPAEDLDTMPDQDRAHAAAMSARADTKTLLVRGAAGLDAYGVFGIDAGGVVVIYAARAMRTGIGSMAFRAMFGAAHVTGHPIRVHSDKIRAMARMIGATEFAAAIDADGIRQGVFRGQ